MSSKPDLSIVIPVYNEAESVSVLHDELLRVLASLSRSFEVIYVDDGSKDTTFEEIKKLKVAKAIRFARNFGKSQALQAGFDEAEGNYIITMDGDLQDDPKEIPNFIKTIEEKHADLIVGWKQRRLDPNNKKIASRFANSVTGLLTGTRVHDMNCCFKIYRSEVAKGLSLYGDLHRFIPALVSSQGFVVDEMPVNHRARQYGVSKYGFSRLFRSLFDFFSLILLRKFADRPMHFFGGVGLLSGFIGSVILIYLAYIRLIGHIHIGTRPLLLFGILLVILGVQLLSLGFMGDLIIRNRPNGGRNFTIREKRF